jgi:ankyrin repeat protein
MCFLMRRYLIQSKSDQLTCSRFLLAQLHMDSLRDKTTAKLIKLALKRLPKGLEALDIAYKEAVERIEAQDKGLQELAKRTLSWVILAKRPLRTSELQHALAIEIGEPEIDLENLTEVEEIISVCTGLVTVDEESDIIRLVHYTTQEYFERTWESWFPNAQDDITKTCVTYLSFNTFAVGLCTNKNEFKARLGSNPLYCYAAKHWGHHASTASIETKESILHFLERDANLLSCNQARRANNRFSTCYRYDQLQMPGIHFAALYGLIEVMATLLKNGCAAGLTDWEGRTPLFWAALAGRVAAVKWLLAEDGIIPDSTNYGGGAPLTHAANEGDEEVVELRFAKGDIDPDPKSLSGQTPLSISAMHGQEAVVKLLLAHGSVDANSKDKYGSTPLFRAAEYGHETVVKLLLTHESVDANSKNNYGSTPLLRAAENGHEAVVRLLLEREDVDIDTKDMDDLTPLWRAAKCGHETVVWLLLEHTSVRDNQMMLSTVSESTLEKVLKTLESAKRDRDHSEYDSEDSG